MISAHNKGSFCTIFFAESKIAQPQIQFVLSAFIAGLSLRVAYFWPSCLAFNAKSIGHFCFDIVTAIIFDVVNSVFEENKKNNLAVVA